LAIKDRGLTWSTYFPGVVLDQELPFGGEEIGPETLIRVFGCCRCFSFLWATTDFVSIVWRVRKTGTGSSGGKKPVRAVLSPCFTGQN